MNAEEMWKKNGEKGDNSSWPIADNGRPRRSTSGDNGTVKDFFDDRPARTPT